MKKLRFILGCALILSITACNNCEESDTAGHSCSKSCSETCSSTHSHDDDGNFDFAMSSVCQASCGVSDYEKSDIVDMAEAEIGDITKCPVSGAIYLVKESSPTLEHDGKTFHACCDGCARKFEEAPARFYKNV